MMGTTSSPSPFLLHLYRFCIRLYPTDFRVRFQTEMVQSLQDGYRQELLQGRVLRARWWLASSLINLILEGLAERSYLSGTRATAGGPSPAFSGKRNRGGLTVSNFLQDVKYSIRSLLRQPSFTAIIVLTVALGVGANTAMFGVVKGVLLNQLPYEDPSRLVIVYENDRMNGTQREGVSGPDYFDWLDQQKSFTSMAAWTSFSPTLTGNNESPERLRATRTSANLFETIGWQPSLGRVFSAAEDVPGGEHVALLSHGLWTRKFGAERSVLGEKIDLDGNEHLVIGVLPQGFRFPTPETDIWLPLQYGRSTRSRGQHNLSVIARMAAGTSLDSARVEMNEIMARLEKQYPRDNVGRGATIDDLNTAVVGTIQSALWILMAAVGLVLLIACANVANLLLTRASVRGQEFAVRAALGAGRGRIIAQLLTESVLLAAVGGLLGLGIAYGGVRLLVSLNPANLPRLDQIGLDFGVLGFASLVALVTGLIFGILPAVQTSRLDLNSSLGSGGRTIAGGAHHQIRRVLAVAQISVAFVLVAGAGLLTQSLWRLTQVDPGFAAENLVTASVNLPESRYPSNFRTWPKAVEVKRFYSEIVERLESHPTVESVALALNHPAASGFTTRIQLDGGPASVEEGIEEERIRPISPGYFATLRTALVKGRDFGLMDRGDSPRVVVVNEAFTRKYFQVEETVLGKRLMFWGPAPREIVGVVSDIRFMGLAQPGRPAVYAPMSQLPFSGFDIVVRGTGEGSDLIAAIRKEIHAIDPLLAVYATDSLEAILESTTSQERFNMIMLGLFAGLALSLASVGVYGVISYGVSRRTHEFGVRMSLGARRGDLIRSVVRQGLTLGLVGIVIGVLGALAGTRIIEGMLFEVQASDPINLVAVAAFLGLISLLACVFPARRAGRVDPSIALRAE